MLDVLVSQARSSFDVLLTAIQRETPSPRPSMLTIHPPTRRNAYQADVSHAISDLDQLSDALADLGAALKMARATVDAQRRRSRFALTSISSLPECVLAEIFHLVCDANGDAREALALSHVCREWYQVAVHQGALWTNFTTTSTGLSSVHQLTSRSNSRCFALSLTSPVPSLLRSLVSPTIREGVRELSFTPFAEADMSKDVNHLDTFFDGLTFTRLEILTLKGENALARIAHRLDFPELKVLRLDRATLNHGLRVPQLEDLRVYGLPHDHPCIGTYIYGLLADAPNVCVLHVGCSFDRIENDSLPVHLHGVPPVRLDKLRTLKLVNTGPDALADLARYIIAPSLTSFVLSDVIWDEEQIDYPGDGWEMIERMLSRGLQLAHIDLNIHPVYMRSILSRLLRQAHGQEQPSTEGSLIHVQPWDCRVTFPQEPNYFRELMFEAIQSIFDMLWGREGASRFRGGKFTADELLFDWAEWDGTELEALGDECDFHRVDRRRRGMW